MWRLRVTKSASTSPEALDSQRRAARHCTDVPKSFNAAPSPRDEWVGQPKKVLGKMKRPLPNKVFLQHFPLVGCLDQEDRSRQDWNPNLSFASGGFHFPALWAIPL